MTYYSPYYNQTSPMYYYNPYSYSRYDGSSQQTMMTSGELFSNTYNQNNYAYDNQYTGSGAGKEGFKLAGEFLKFGMRIIPSIFSATGGFGLF